MTAGGPLLELAGVAKRFGELRAVDGVSLDLREGETTAIIGPNGAGKTTLFDLMTARRTADAGRIRFLGREITDASPDTVARRGLVRTFQISSVFPALSVRDNVLTAVLARLRRGAIASRPLRREREALDRTVRIMESVGLLDVGDVSCADLSHGDRRRVEVGMGLALRPRLMLLDEPTAGMAPAERRATADLLAELAGRGEVTLLLTEHDIDLVMRLAARIVVMHQGGIIADGPPREIAQHPEVRRAYLGETR